MNGAGYSYKLFRHTFSPPCSTLSTSSKVNHILFSPLVSLANVLVHGNHVFRGTTSSLRLSSLKRRSSGKFTSRLCSGLAWQRVPRMLILSKRILPKEKKKKTNSVHAFLITISSLHANVSFSQSSNINSEGMQNGGNTTNRRIQSFWRIFSNGDVFSKVGESRPRKKKEGRRSIALKMKRELPFLPSSSFSLSLSSRFSYPSAKKTSPRSIFNPAAKLFNWESFRRAIYKPRSKIRRTRDAWYIVGQDSRPLVVGWGTDVAWWSPLPDGETWVGGRPPAQGETDGKRKKLCETAKPALQSWDAP